MSPVEGPPSAPPVPLTAAQTPPDPEVLPPVPARALPAARLRASILPAAAAILGVALMTRLVFPHALLGYDPQFALIWGDDLAGGSLPDYDVPFAPTPHPLTVLMSAVAALAGHNAAVDILIVLAYVFFATMVWTVYRLGRLAFSWPVGVLAAVLVGTRYPILGRGLSAYLDIPFVALVFFAAGSELVRPRRGAPVLLMLALAGLLRPEAWVLAGCYLLYLSPVLDWRRQVELAVLVIAAPALWMLSDAIVTGDPRFSFHGAREVASAASAVASTLPDGGKSQASYAFDALRSILRAPVLVTAPVGLVIAARTVRTRSWIPAALLVLGLGLYGGLVAVGLPTTDRFLFLPSAAACLFCAFLAVGWIHEPVAGRLRIAGTVTGVLAGAVLLASVPGHVSRLDRLDGVLAEQQRFTDDLKELARVPRVRATLNRCSPIWLPTNQPLPALAYETGLPLGRFAVLKFRGPQPRRGTFVAPATERVAEIGLSRAHVDAPPVTVPAGFRRAGGNASWIVYRRGC
jgi:hypothetical protein